MSVQRVTTSADNGQGGSAASAVFDNILENQNIISRSTLPASSHTSYADPPVIYQYLMQNAQYYPTMVSSLSEGLSSFRTPPEALPNEVLNPSVFKSLLPHKAVIRFFASTMTRMMLRDTENLDRLIAGTAKRLSSHEALNAPEARDTMMILSILNEFRAIKQKYPDANFETYFGVLVTGAASNPPTDFSGV